MSYRKPIFYLALGETVIWAGLYYVFPALLVQWENDLGWSKISITGAITVAILLSALSSPFSGRLIDSGRGPQVLSFSALIGSVSLFCLGFVTHIYQFYFLWGVIGICFSGCLYDPCFAFLTRGLGEKAKQNIIIITLIAGLASTLSFPFAHTFSQWFGWRVTVMIFATFVALVGAPLLWIGASQIEQQRASNEKSRTSSSSPSFEFYLSPIFLLLATSFAIVGVVHSATLQHLIPILLSRGVASDTAVILASFIGPMQVAGRLAMMGTQNHLSNHHIAISCFIVVGISISVLIFSSVAQPLVVLFVVLFGGGYGMVSIIRPVIAREILGESNFGVKFGALSMVYLIGAATAPFFGSLIWQIGGYETLLPGLVALCVVGLALFLSAQKRAKAVQ